MIVHLNGPWDLFRDGSPERFAARVPGCILLAAGAIPDPFVGENGVVVQAATDMNADHLSRSLHIRISFDLYQTPIAEREIVHS